MSLCWLANYNNNNNNMCMSVMRNENPSIHTIVVRVRVCDAFDFHNVEMACDSIRLR